MSISGSLQDVSVADVMQFIHLGRRTGTLVLARGRERAMVGFHLGKLVSAQAPRTPKLGDLLVQAGLIDGAELQAAVAAQERAVERRTLGQLLVASGAIEPQALRNAVVQQIEQAVSEVIAWDRGTFDFAVGDLRPVDDVALYPGDVIPDADINTQMVLLEAARIFDERNRGGGATTDETHPAAGEGRAATALADPEAVVSTVAEPEPEAWGEDDERGVHRLQMVTSDAALADALEHALPPGFAPVEPVGLRAAGKAFPGHETPIVLLDLRREGVTVQELGRLRRTRRGTPLVALVEPGTPLGP
ncbi:MAG: DUF4388 domain-containing protein, partial [Thermoanaerobaculia bacterium]